MEEHQPGLDKKAYYVHTTSGMNMDSLIKAIRHTNPDIRWRAALALGDIGEPAIKPLIALLREEDSDIQWRSAFALSLIGKPAVNDLDWYVRWSAADALGKIGDKKAAVCLGKALKESDSYVQVSATWAPGKLGSSAPVETLMQSLKNPDWYVRWEISATCVHLNC